ncbi:MAG TPA: hypothetical protein DCM40_12215, partial [Maribacter sp.]|nr:hypothetical protein [Maribacter sp.]
LKLFLSDIIKEDDEFKNRQDDNARIVITNVVNTAAKVDTADGAYSEPEEDEERGKNPKQSILKYRAYEFLSTDNGLDGLDLLSYRRFSETGDKKKDFIPQVYMLQDIIEKYADNGGTPPKAQQLKNTHDSIMDSLFQNFAEQVYTRDKAFRYGAEYDDLTYEETEYGVENEAGNFVEYSKYAENFKSRTGDALTNEDAVLGLSRDQFENGDKARVFYLDPAKHGGNYFNPPLYIKPVKNTGWLGFVNVMFPEIGPCKPYRADVIDFGSIQGRINDTYSRIPEDERLKTDPDCVREEPYNRILERPAKAGIEGLISAAIRIYASVHILKA